MKASYGSASEIDGFGDLQAGEKEKVERAWDAGAVPDEDQGPGEPVEAAGAGKKKAAAPRKKKDEDGEKPKRGRKPKVRTPRPLSSGGDAVLMEWVGGVFRAFTEG